MMQNVKLFSAAISIFKNLFRKIELQHVDQGFSLIKNLDVTSKIDYSGVIIECIGPSGVGKTTLVDAFMSSCKFPWYFGYPANGSNATGNYFNRVESDVHYKHLLQRKIENFSHDRYSAPHFFDIISYFVNILRQEHNVRYHVPLSHEGVLLDEGIIHNFKDIIIPFLNEHGHILDFLGNRVIIAFKASPDIILERLQKRAVESPHAPNNWIALGVDAAEIKIEESLVLQQQFLDLWTSLGGIAYTVDFSSKVEPIDQFLHIEQEIVKQFNVTHRIKLDL